LDSLAKIEVDLDRAYVDADPKMDALPPEYSDSTILTSILRYGFLRLDFLSSELETQTENKIIFKNNIELWFFSDPTPIRDQI
jgi:hypothetical protein